MFEIKFNGFNTNITAWKKSSFLIVDNCYDSYIKNQYLKYINDNGVKFIASQDHDLSYLSDCPDIEFVLCSHESNHLEALYSLRNLKGLWLATDDTAFDFSKLSPTLSFLRTKYERQNKSWLYHGSITDLSLDDYATENLLWLSEMKNKDKVRTFEIYTSYGKFRSLKGIKELSNLEVLILDYCRKLTDIAEITELTKLKVLQYYDNPRATKLPLDSLTTLEKIYLIDRETSTPGTIETLGFINYLPNLHTFWSNYNVLDGDLSLLLRLKDVDIFPDRKHYNLKNSDLPHIVK